MRKQDAEWEAIRLERMASLKRRDAADKKQKTEEPKAAAAAVVTAVKPESAAAPASRFEVFDAAVGAAVASIGTVPRAEFEAAVDDAVALHESAAAAVQTTEASVREHSDSIPFVMSLCPPCKFKTLRALQTKAIKITIPVGTVTRAFTVASAAAAVSAMEPEADMQIAVKTPDGKVSHPDSVHVY